MILRFSFCLVYTEPQFHLLKESALRVNLPFFFNGPLPLDILAQKDFLLAFCLGERPVFLVTGACKLLPVSRLYFSRHLAVSPPLGFLHSFLPRNEPLDTKDK